MAAKYFVWGEGVWRELDMASGRVSGWRRRARFVFVRRGRLLVARHRPVLRALQALAASSPGAAADGPRLSHRSKTKPCSKPSQASPAVAPGTPAMPPVCMHQHHCCTHNRCVDISTQSPASHASHAPPTPIPAAGELPRRDVSSQWRQLGAACAAHGFTINLPHSSSTATSAPTNAAVTVANASSADDFTNMFTPKEVRTDTSGLDALLARHVPVSKPRAATYDNKITSQKDRRDGVQRAEKRVRTDSNGKAESSGSEQACKELLVSDADVAAVRAFVRMRHPEAVKRFDEDEAYKRQLFYSINPLVELERCARLERLLRQRAAAALPHFAARLGLTPSSNSSTSTPARTLERPRPGGAHPRRARSASTDTDKENKEKYSSPNKVRSETGDEVKKPPRLKPTPAASEPVPPRASRRGVSERSNKQKEDVMIKAAKTNGDVSDSPKTKRPVAPPPALRVKKEAPSPPALDAVRVLPGTHVISRRAATAKEYSNLEDHAIVAWVGSGARATLVSGNRVWRDLQEQYERLTGRARSWHSLRNRYLRYILPALGALHLPPAEVSRLRAGAATGVIKSKLHRAPGVTPKRHSMFKEPERGASSRRPRSAESSDDDAEAPPAGDNIGDDANDPSPPKRRSLRTQPPHAAHRDKSDDCPSQAAGSQAANQRSASTSQGKEAGRKARTPRYSEVTRRFAARHPSPRSRSSSRSPSPSSPRSPSPVLAAGTRSRRLFNPNADV